MKDTYGVPTSKEFIANQIWNENMSIRVEVMKAVPYTKSIVERQRNCIKYMVDNMIDFQVNGEVLTGNLS